jgi:hypothetical protein
MTKQQLREAIRRIIRQELNEEKTTPNPNAGKWRIVGADSGNPLTKEFYNSKEEAQEAARKLGRTKESGIKYVQLKDTMKVHEAAPAETKPKPGVKKPPVKTPDKKDPRRRVGNPEIPKKSPSPAKAEVKKATMEEASKLKDIIQRFKSRN